MPKIWTRDMSLETLTKRSEKTLMDSLGIKFIEIGEDFLKASMPVDERTKQPLGILNGGATCGLVESLASCAGNFCVKSEKDYCVGLEINANHIRSVRDSFVVATARPLHLGSKTQIWDVRVEQKDQLICVARMTLMVLQRT